MNEEIIRLISTCKDHVDELKNALDELQSNFLSYYNKEEKIDVALTDLEKSALAAIQKALDKSDVISISQLTHDSGISRPVFKNLLLKLEKNDIVEVKNMGVKGTLIKFLKYIDN